MPTSARMLGTTCIAPVGHDDLGVPLRRTTCLASVGRGDHTPGAPRRHRPAPPPVGGGLRPAPLGKGSVSHRFPLLRNAPSPRRGGPMCPPGHASSRDPFTGRHTGRPLQIPLPHPLTPQKRTGTEPRPYRSIVVPSSGPMYLRHGFRRPNFVPKFGASVMVIGPYGKKSKPHQPPESAAHSGAFAAWMGGNGWELRQRPSPRCPATPDNPSVMAFGHASSLYTREPLGTGDTDCRVASLLAMTVLILCHSEKAQRADVGIRLFYDGRGTGRRT